MEDCKIYYDQTVRNATGAIVQFLFGEDGMDGTKVEKQSVPTLVMNLVQLDAMYHLRPEDNLSMFLTKEAMEQMGMEPEWREKSEKHFQNLLDDRSFLIYHVFHEQKNDTIVYPIAFDRILKTAQQRLAAMGLVGVPTDLTPGYILNALEDLQKRLYILRPDQGIRFLHILLNIHLAPKPLLTQYVMPKPIFDWIVSEIERSFIASIAQAGEMVGIVAAQSLGEMATQQSCAKDTRIRVLGKDIQESYSGSIGGFIDGLLEKHNEWVHDLGHGSVVLDLAADYHILGVSTTEKNSWKRIMQVSRHPANGGMVKVTTRSGRTTTATLSHSFLRRSEVGVVPILGSALQVGDRIPVARSIPCLSERDALRVMDVSGEQRALDSSLGAHIGAFIANPSVQEDTPWSTWLVDNFSEHLAAWVYGCHREFLQGILEGVFRGSHEFFHAHKAMVDDVLVLMGHCDLFGIKTFDDVRNAYGICVAQDMNEMDVIPATEELLCNVRDTFDLPPFTSAPMTRALLQNSLREIKEVHEGNDNIRELLLLEQAATSDVVWDEIVKLEYMEDPKEFVYDFTVPGNETFMVDAGVLVHNTLDSFHSSGTAAAVKATSGVPRMKELLSVSKNIKTPTMLIYLKPDVGTVVSPQENEDGDVEDPRIQETKDKAMRVMHSLETTRLLDVLDATETFWDPPQSEGLVTGIEEDDGFLAVYRAFAEVHKCRSSSPWVLRMRLNREKMYRLGLSMMDVYLRIHTAYQNQVECLFSDDNAPEMVLRVRLAKEALKDVDPEDAVAALKAMEHNLVHNVLLKGLKGIKKVSMHLSPEEIYEPEVDTFHKVAHWVLDTDGTNLVDMLANPNIDPVRTRSNDIWEIYHALGIEAARNALYKEFMGVVGEDAINYRHMSLLLDTMTNRGTLMSIDRHGINRGDVGPLAKCSFEETTDMLINASIFSEYDRINGVSANIMLGQLPPCGTGDHEVLLDEEAYVRMLREKAVEGPSAHISATDVTPMQPAEELPELVLSMPYDTCAKQKKKLVAPKITFV